MHAAKPASLQTAQRQAYRVFARCPRSLAGPSRRGGGSHCVPFMVDLKPPDSSITSEVSTLRTRADMQMPSHPLPYLPAAGRCAIRHPPSAMPTEAPASMSTMRAIPGLVHAPCLEFTVSLLRICHQASSTLFRCPLVRRGCRGNGPPCPSHGIFAQGRGHCSPCPTLPDPAGSSSIPGRTAPPGRGAGFVTTVTPPLCPLLPLPREFINTALVTPLHILQSKSVTNCYSCMVSDTMAFGFLIISSPSEAYLKSWRILAKTPCPHVPGSD